MSLGEFRTVIAHFVVRHLHRPHPLVVTAWLWLAANADGFDEKRRCLEAVLEIDPDNTRPLLALVALRSGKGDE
jgi:hypothetical protein